jgi:hypothetical protein
MAFRSLLPGLGALLLAGPVWADEGFWTFNNFPAESVQSAYGFLPTPGWLDHVRLSSLRTPGQCSASFVSDQGLVLTNHHCAVECVEHLSTAAKNYLTVPFVATRIGDEARCPGLELNQLTAITRVTDQIRAATKDLTGEAFKSALKATMTRIESACTTTDTDRCDVVELYRGGEYDLYKYRRYQDVRLVFAPEYSAGQFGGDPDNFSYPRYGFDVSFYRTYENGHPVDSRANYFRWSTSGPVDGELTFVSGHPGRTYRLLTLEQLQFDRDTRLPFALGYYAEQRGLLTEFSTKGQEENKMVGPDLFTAENNLKSIKGQFESILDRSVIGQMEQSEHALRSAVETMPSAKEFAEAWPIIAKVVDHYRKIYMAYVFVEGVPQRMPLGFQSRLAAIAKTLVRASEELAKPDGQRLREYTEANLPALKQTLFSAAPIHQELEVVELTFTLTKLREELGADALFVRQLLKEKSPAELARALVESSSLANVEERKRIFDGGRDAIKASADPMTVATRDVIDPYAREVRGDYETNVEAPFAKGGEMIARAILAVRGTSAYPDATGTLRLSFGQAKKPESGFGSYVTTISGAFDRSTGRDPFALPPSWLEAKDQLKLDLPLNVVTTNDIVGGNSGSPLLNKESEIVGLVFDSNLEGRGNAYVHREVARTVAVDSACILEILSKVYKADRIAGEITEANRH